MKNMDTSSLREQYRTGRDSQRKHTHVLLFSAVSEELSEAVSIVPVTQGLTLSLVDFTFVPPPDPMTFDPWHIHLDHHRRSCSGITETFPPTCSHISCSSRCSSSSSSESRVDSSDSLSSCRESSPCIAPCCVREEEHRPRAGSVCGSEVDSVSASLNSSQQNVHLRPTESTAPGTLTCSDFTPVACSAPHSSTSVLHTDLKTSQSTALKTRTSSSSSRQLKIIRQQSVSTDSSSSWVRQSQTLSQTLSQSQSQSQSQTQTQSYYPFPSRKTQRISETARKLGMYSSICLSK